MGVDVNEKNASGALPLCRSVLCNQVDVTCILLENGADVNKANTLGWVPLHYAASRGYTEIVKILLEAGADVNKSNKDGWTPLYYAVHNGHIEIMKLLEDAMDKKAKDPQATDKVKTPAVQQETKQSHTQGVIKEPVCVSRHTAKTLPSSTVWMTFVHTKED